MQDEPDKEKHIDLVTPKRQVLTRSRIVEDRGDYEKGQRVEEYVFATDGDKLKSCPPENSADEPSASSNTLTSALTPEFAFALSVNMRVT